MTIDEAIKELRDASDSEVRYGDTEYHYDKVMKRVEAFEMAIKALEQQPCEDVLSRQTVLQCIKESREGIDWGQSEDEDAFLHYTAALYRTIANKECFPSVNPQQKSGEWVNMGNHEVNPNIYIFKCSNCHKKMMIPLSERLMYCPNCGSYNGGDEE